MDKPKKLIEVAMPIREVSAESVRDKSIRHGHISTLHLWWARRPLPVCRAVVFASLVPDPLDPRCPPAFAEAVGLVLGPKVPGDLYRPYADIPYTAVVDPMADNPRNRLLMFIGKFSEKYAANARTGKTTPPKEQLADGALVKWESRTDRTVINRARKLIWAAHNADSGMNAKDLLADHDRHAKAIEVAEQDLQALTDRHLPRPEVQEAEKALQAAIDTYQAKMPSVFDPFAGGGAIPLEAARLGCRSYGNDLNPVAHIIQRGSLEFPQRYGKPIIMSNESYLSQYGQEAMDNLPTDWKVVQNGKAKAVRIPNRLSHDVAHYSKRLIAQTDRNVGHLYPSDEKGNRPIAYYWARTGHCANPSCEKEIPLLKQLYLVNKDNLKIHLRPKIENGGIYFDLVEEECTTQGFVQSRKSLLCPHCGNLTSNTELKKQFNSGKSRQRLLAVITESENRRIYRLPTKSELTVLDEIPEDSLSISEIMPKENTKQFDVCPWGFITYGDLFSKRQAHTMKAFLDSFNALKLELETASDYGKAVLVYLAILVDRIAVVNTSFGVWHTKGEKLERIMGRQAIPMVFDFPESNPFCSSSGSAWNQLDWLTRYIESECESPFYTALRHASSGERSQFGPKELTAVVTDPPYYDAIAYADLSDFFYVWLKRTLGDVYPDNFSTPQTPKGEECTALKHHHNGKVEAAKQHFEDKLLQIFDAIEYQTQDIVSIMFAHQSTEAWTTLCNSILGARMNITGSWATDTEMMGALKTDKSYLSSSVTVCARPAQRQGVGRFRDVREAIGKRVSHEVEKLYSLGFRGADLLTACFGQAVSEFGRYASVEKADGKEVTVAELLELARESAFNALLKGFKGDEPTKFYIGWLQLYGMAETDFDDAAKFSRVGLSIDVQELFASSILISSGNRQHLASFAERIALRPHLGDRTSDLLIDHVHRAMHLYAGTDRKALLRHIAAHGQTVEEPLWRVLNSLAETLPSDGADREAVNGLLTNRDSLIRESTTVGKTPEVQAKLF